MIGLVQFELFILLGSAIVLFQRQRDPCRTKDSCKVFIYKRFAKVLDYIN